MLAQTLKLKYGRWGAYNNPEINERKVELPLGLWFAQCFPDDLIEIGEVTPFYWTPRHLVYDMLPEKPDTRRIDATAIEILGKNVLSISTVEHVGTADYGLPPEPGKAFSLIKRITDEARNWLITFPIGYNTELDNEIFSSNLRFFVLARNRDNTWHQPTLNEDIRNCLYNSPLPHGNAVIVVTNLCLEIVFDGYVDGE